MCQVQLAFDFLSVMICSDCE